DPDVLRGEIDGVTAKLRHPGLERQASAQRRLLEDHRERAAAEVRMLEAGTRLVLEPLRETQQALQLFGAERGEIEQVALAGLRMATVARRGFAMRRAAALRSSRVHRAAAGAAAEAVSARSIILRPASASSRVSVSGGSSRKTFSAVALTSRRSRRQASAA